MLLNHSFYRNQRGFVLPVGLMFLAILAVIGTTAVVVTTTDIRIGGNHKASAQAHYATVAGYEEARGRLGLSTTDANYTGQVGTPDGNWRGFIGDAGRVAAAFGYDANNTNHHLFASLQGSLNYAAMIRHKTDAGGNILLWGDSNGDYNLEVNLTDGEPIAVISSQGTAGGSIQTVTVEARGAMFYFDPPAALYVNGNLDKNGAAGEVQGTYNPVCAPKPDIMTTTNAGACPPKNCEANDWPAGTSTPPWLVDDESDLYPVAHALSGLGSNPDNLIPPGSYTNPTGWGSVSEPYQITYCDGDLDINNLTGYGILAVNGDFTARGNVGWKGIIIVKGTTIISGGGHLSIYGAMVADSISTINGQPDIYYDCAITDNINNNNVNYSLYSWLES